MAFLPVSSTGLEVVAFEWLIESCGSAVRLDRDASAKGVTMPAREHERKWIVVSIGLCWLTVVQTQT